MKHGTASGGGSAPIARAGREFRRTLGRVERARAALVSAAPRGRAVGVPAAEAVASFEAELRAAADLMPGWRHPDAKEAWRACDEGLREALRRAERLRLHAAPEGYEHLYALLGDALEPLDVFGPALRRLRQLGGL